ncbi:hypothetical protein BZL30_8137 [Mycobacterium kansasii]|uniref:Uncharacterized protein n=1 Tax=Mycobacterium kansasii TaxID=1768 RepID=A0A1V3WJG5_MYCKA|nr:hypothetical protein BZL30_8137 [Mycobacterium kansasii]
MQTIFPRLVTTTKHSRGHVPSVRLADTRGSDHSRPRA